MNDQNISKERAAIRKYRDDRNFDQWSIFVAVQVIVGSIFYLLFFVWM